MAVTRREFVRNGVSAFTVSFAAPAFLSDLARAQGRSQRNLVVLYLSGGNDALSTLVPYTDPQYYARRPTLAIAPAGVLQIGSDRAGNALGLNSRLPGLKSMFDAGRLAIIQRTGYPNSSRSHFEGTDIWSTGDPRSPQGTGWLGRYLDTLPSPVDPLSAWSTVRETPRTLLARTVGVPSIPSVSGYAFAGPNTAADAVHARNSALRIASHLPADQPHLSFVNATAQDAFATLDRVADGEHLRAGCRLLQQRLCAGAARRCRRHRERSWHQGVLGPDRRLRHSRAAEHERGQRLLFDADDVAQRRVDVVLPRPRSPGPAARHADPAVLGVRPAHQRERQQRHRPRRRRPDAGDRRRSAWRALWHCREADAPPPTILAWRTTAATCATRPTSDRSTPR